jgi:twitching motility protein PilT
MNIIGDNLWHIEDLLRHGSCDASYSLSDQARFRVNIFSQRGSFSIVCRQLNAAVPTLQQLKFPEIFTEIPKEKTGLVLITGATGSGKSTTLAAILDEINRTKAVHIVTLEDPVEYLHKHQVATFNQRELGLDFDTYANGLRAALRQAPKVILVGEMRDRDTVKIALSAAETGHLVLSTLHTINAGETINRILGMFEPDEQEQVRTRLSDSLRWIASQRLVPRLSGGRFALIELMGSNLRTQETIRLGESEGKTFLRDHRGQLSLRLAHFRQRLPRRLRAGAHLRGNRPALLHQAQRRLARHRQHQEGARRDERQRQHAPHEKPQGCRRRQ